MSELNDNITGLNKFVLSCEYLERLNKLSWFQFIAKHKLNKWYNELLEQS